MGTLSCGGSKFSYYMNGAIPSKGCGKDLTDLIRNKLEMLDDNQNPLMVTSSGGMFLGGSLGQYKRKN